MYFARLPHMERSFRKDNIYAPGPTCPDDANNSMKLYAAYRATEDSLFPCKTIAFIDYVRTHHVVNGVVKLRPTKGGGHNTGKTTTAVGVRFGYEMHDESIFHYCAMFFPHYHREAFIATEFSLKFTMCFLGCLRYLTSLSPGDTDETVYGEAIPGSTHRYRYSKFAFPQPLPTLPMSNEVAFAYMSNCMQTDLRMRVCDARVATFLARLEFSSADEIFTCQSTIGRSVAFCSRRHASPDAMVRQTAGISRRCCGTHQRQRFQ